MNRSPDKDGQASHAFVDIATGQFVFREPHRTTSRVQVFSASDVSLPDDAEAVTSASQSVAADAPTDDAP